MKALWAGSGVAVQCTISKIFGSGGWDLCTVYMGPAAGGENFRNTASRVQFCKGGFQPPEAIFVKYHCFGSIIRPLWSRFLLNTASLDQL